MSGNILIIIGMIAVLAVLAVGIVSMFRGGAFNRKYANKMMQLRVLIQFGVLIVIAILLLLGQG